MSKLSFEDIGAVVATCQVEEGVTGGQVVKLTDASQVGPCAAGDKFCGVAMEPRAGLAGVQFKGFVTVSCTGDLTHGWATLAADGNGGVKADENGHEYLVVATDTTAATAVVRL